MTDLTKMWDALARYQPFADADGHGETWRMMCEQRTADAAAVAAAAYAAKAGAAAAKSAAAKAAWAAWAAEAAADAAYWSDLAIASIEQAIKKREPELSDTAPVPDDAGQAPKMDAQPEPVGWVKIDEVRQHFDSVSCGTIYRTSGEGRKPLYAASPRREWVGLTGGDISIIYGATWGRPLDDWGPLMGDFARAIEAKLKERNHD